MHVTGSATRSAPATSWHLEVIIVDGGGSVVHHESVACQPSQTICQITPETLWVQSFWMYRGWTIPWINGRSAARAYNEQDTWCD